MIPPPSMLTIKNPGGLLLALAIGLWLGASGCTPAGPRELLAGKKLLERGKYAQAIEKFREASSLMPTNAQAWNYLGLACHYAGQNAEAERAYQRALALDHDLTEAHYNLGCLLLSLNRLEAAKTEFTAYTLRRNSSLDGLLKLGTVQLRLREGAGAEKSFTDALRLKPEDPEALTGIGLSRVARGKPRDSIAFFTRALKQKPDYGPALLNMAVVVHQHLQDREMALKIYREYAALKPAPESLQSLQATIRRLEQELAPVAKPVPVPPGALAQPPGMLPVKPPATNPPRAVAVARPDLTTNAARSQPLKPEPTKPAAITKQDVNPAPGTPGATNPPTVAAPARTVQRADEPGLRAAEDVATRPAGSPKGTAAPSATTGSTTPAGSQNLKAPKESLVQNMAGAGSSSSEGPVQVQVPRYAYKSPPKPVAGNRVEAERVFAQAYQAYEVRKLSEAIQGYRRAGELDPAFFDAFYNLGVAATENSNPQLALSSYETALAVRPESLDARYNFALVLKQSGYFLDAANELEKVLRQYPNESRAHLVVGNLYAQQLHQPAKAREHYLKVLENDPRNPQAGAIRYWLAGNPR